MNDNAYKSPTIVDPPRRTRGTRWAIRSGIACLVAAAVCSVLTVAWMISSFRIVAEASSTPKAEDLADGISNALIPALGIVPFGLLGIILVVIGLLVRCPMEE